ncbi:MAG: hypothetical protein AAEJ53_08970 [Myxococcota bacterium]
MPFSRGSFESVIEMHRTLEMPGGIEEAISMGFPRRAPPVFPRSWPWGCLLALLIAALPAPAAEPEEPFWLSTIRREFELPSTTALQVSNRFGDIRARGLNQGPLQVIAVVQRFEEDQEEAQIQVVEESGTLRIEIHYPSAASAQAGAPLRGRVDVTVMVPRGNALALEIDAGLIEAKGIDRDLSAESQSGRIEVITSRPLETHTGEADTQLLLKASDPNHPHRIRSGSGHIELNLPASQPLSLRARTRGKITPRLSADLEPLLEEAGEERELRVGSAPFAIQLESASGDIELHSR